MGKLPKHAIEHLANTIRKAHQDVADTYGATFVNEHLEPARVGGQPLKERVSELAAARSLRKYGVTSNVKALVRLNAQFVKTLVAMERNIATIMHKWGLSDGEVVTFHNDLALRVQVVKLGLEEIQEIEAKHVAEEVPAILAESEIGRAYAAKLHDVAQSRSEAYALTYDDRQLGHLHNLHDASVRDGRVSPYSDGTLKALNGSTATLKVKSVQRRKKA